MLLYVLYFQFTWLSALMNLVNPPAEDSSELLVRVGDSGGGQYSVNYGNVFKNLACATLDSIVLERFGSKPARIFR